MAQITAYDGNMAVNSSNMAISARIYLPGGDLANNALPGVCNCFCYLKVDADLSAIYGAGATEVKVFVPCYYREPG
jgi:hypothetical protein